MKTLKSLSLILVALIAMGASCNRPPKPQPPQPGINGEITSDPIVENGEEVGYSLSYRSWIIPGTDENGEKAPTPPKSVYNDKSSDSDGSFAKSATYDAKGGGNSNDTISVILHDTFYHVDTIAYVSTWDPDKYKQGSYTCHWDKYGLARPGENNVTVTDSAIVLRVQFEEFSFQYRINFETATYRDGIVNIPFPHHTPVITDLGVEELESLETICRNDSVLARKVLHHSIKISVGNKNYILKANVMLHRHLPDANPNRYIVSSHMTTPVTWSPVSDRRIGGSFNVHRVWSDGSTEDEDVILYTYHCINAAMATLSSTTFSSCDDVNIDTTFGSFTMPSSWLNLEPDDGQAYDFCYSTSVEGVFLQCNYPHIDVPAEGTILKTNHAYYDDGVLYYKAPQMELSFEYSHSEIRCDGNYAVYLICWCNQRVGNMQLEPVGMAIQMLFQ